MSFGDVAEVRVGIITNYGTRSATMMLAMTDALRGWTGLPGPEKTLFNSAALWTSSTGRL